LIFLVHQGEYSEYSSTVQQSDSESIELENLRAADLNRLVSLDNEIVQEDVMDTTLEQRVKNHVVAAAIFAGTFVLPCFIAAKVLK
jgi:hypothetical protein